MNNWKVLVEKKFSLWVRMFESFFKKVFQARNIFFFAPFFFLMFYVGPSLAQCKDWKNGENFRHELACLPDWRLSLGVSICLNMVLIEAKMET